jgi:hypothetical protein
MFISSFRFVVFSGCNSENADLVEVVHKSLAPVKKGAGPPAGAKSGAKMTKLQIAMAEKNQARSGKQVMFKVEEACCIRFSPKSDRLAVGSRDNNIYIFDVEKNYRRIGICRGHTSYITHIDWSQTGEFLQSNSGDYELLYWQSPESEIFRTNHIVPGSPRKLKHQRRWDQYRDMSDMADCQWYSWTSTLGFPVMGIWPPYSDGTDVNMVDRSKNRKLVATGEDTFKISLMRFPCLKGTAKKQFHGHMSHVMNVRWNNDDKYLFSAGGLDCCTFQWLHTEKDGNPVETAEEETKPPPTQFGAPPAAEQMTVYNPDDGYGVEEGDVPNDGQQIDRTPEPGEESNEAAWGGEKVSVEGGWGGGEGGESGKEAQPSVEE